MKNKKSLLGATLLGITASLIPLESIARENVFSFPITLKILSNGQPI